MRILHGAAALTILGALAFGAHPAVAHPGGGNDQGGARDHDGDAGHDTDGDKGRDQGEARGRPSRGTSALTPPAGAADADATGRADVKLFPAIGHRPARSWFRIFAAKLPANASFTLWIDDPSTADPAVVQVGTATYASDAEGDLKIRFDTKRGDSLPFGATLTALAGKAVEIHDSGGHVVLAGQVPAAQ